MGWDCKSAVTLLFTVYIIVQYQSVIDSTIVVVLWIVTSLVGYSSEQRHVVWYAPFNPLISRLCCFYADISQDYERRRCQTLSPKKKDKDLQAPKMFF